MFAPKEEEGHKYLFDIFIKWVVSWNDEIFSFLQK